MQVNSISPITVIWRDKSAWRVDVYGQPLFFSKPVAFRWPDSHLRPITPKLINWLQTDFKNLFEYDPFLWMASVGTVDPKLRPYLKDLFNE